MHTETLPKQFKVILSIKEIECINHALAIASGMVPNTTGVDTRKIMVDMHSQLKNTLKQP